jgi:hypothetical protein
VYLRDHLLTRQERRSPNLGNISQLVNAIILKTFRSGEVNRCGVGAAYGYTCIHLPLAGAGLIRGKKINQWTFHKQRESRSKIKKLMLAKT